MIRSFQGQQAQDGDISFIMENEAPQRRPDGLGLQLFRLPAIMSPHLCQRHFHTDPAVQQSCHRRHWRVGGGVGGGGDGIQTPPPQQRQGRVPQLLPAEGVCLIMIQDSKTLFVTSKCRRRSETTKVAMLMRDKQPKQHLQQRKKRQEQQKPCEITV